MTLAKWASAALLVVAAGTQAADLSGVLNGPQRSEQSQARDQYRHPQQTLSFFGLQPDMTVVEIWPGSGGWYTELLAPYLRDQGKLYEAIFPENGGKYYQHANEKFKQKLASMPSVCDRISLTQFKPPKAVDIAPPGSADMVLTFRNVHNWYMGNGDEDVIAAFKAFYTALKPGGILGVVDHHLPADRPQSDQKESGYMHQQYVIDMAKKAGFKLVATSPVNANPKDNADHPKGVWTLPPTLALKDKDKEKYLAIGESDRMTLKFVKPATM